MGFHRILLTCVCWSCWERLITRRCTCQCSSAACIKVRKWDEKTCQQHFPRVIAINTQRSRYNKSYNSHENTSTGPGTQAPGPVRVKKRRWSKERKNALYEQFKSAWPGCKKIQEPPSNEMCSMGIFVKHNTLRPWTSRTPDPVHSQSWIPWTTA